MAESPLANEDGAPRRAQPSITVVEGEYGAAADLTRLVEGELERLHLTYRTVPGARWARRNVPLPTVLASFDGDETQVAFHGYGRIRRDFLPQVMHP